LKSAIKFWLEIKQVDGLRIDAVKFIFERQNLQDEPLILENLNKTVKIKDYLKGQIITVYLN
jgi:glycosidase